jgi:hypothetical protein
MILNLMTHFKRLLANTLSSLLVVALIFQLAAYSFAGTAIAADFNSPLLAIVKSDKINSEKMADQVQGQLDLEKKGTTDRKNTQYGAATKGTQKIDPDRSSQDVDRVQPTVELTNKDMSNQLTETEKLGKGAGIKAAEKGGELLDNVKDFFDKK